MILILDFVGIIIELLLLYLACFIVSGEKNIFEGKKKIAVVATLLIKVSTIFMPIMQINVTATILCLFIIAVFVYNISAWKAIFMVATFMSLFNVSDLITTLIMTRIFADDYSQMAINPSYRITGVFLSNIINFGLIIIASFIFRKKVKDLPLRYWIFAFVCPVLSYGILLMIDTLMIHSNLSNPLYVIIPVIVFLYLNYIVFDFFETYSKSLEYESMKIADAQSRENYKILEESENEIRILRHDLKNHISVMDLLADREDINSLKEYISQMKVQTENASAYIYTKNQALDSIVNIKMRKAENHGIKFIAKVERDIEIKINPMDLATLIGNALDNAIEGNDCSKEAFIELDICENNDMLIISVINSANEPVKTDKGYKTSKKDIKNHGFGMKSMQKTIKKYDGDMCSEYSNGMFYLKIFVKNMSLVGEKVSFV